MKTPKDFAIKFRAAHILVRSSQHYLVSMDIVAMVTYWTAVGGITLAQSEIQYLYGKAQMQH